MWVNNNKNYVTTKWTSEIYRCIPFAKDVMNSPMDDKELLVVNFFSHKTLSCAQGSTHDL